MYELRFDDFLHSHKIIRSDFTKFSQCSYHFISGVGQIKMENEDFVVKEREIKNEPMEEQNFSANNSTSDKSSAANNLCNVCNNSFESATDLMIHTATEHLAESIRYIKSNMSL